MGGTGEWQLSSTSLCCHLLQEQCAGVGAARQLWLLAFFPVLPQVCRVGAESVRTAGTAAHQCPPGVSGSVGLI